MRATNPKTANGNQQHDHRGAGVAAERVLRSVCQPAGIDFTESAPATLARRTKAR